MKRPDMPERGPFFSTALAGMEQQVVLDAERPLMELLEHPGWRFLADLVSARADALHKATLAVDAKDHLAYIVNAAEERVLRALLDAPKDAIATAKWVDEKRRQHLESRERQAAVSGGRR